MELKLADKMITTFDILQVSALLAGAWIGYRVGYAAAGSPGAIAGVVVGIAMGWVLGRLPFILTFRWVLRSLKRASSADLRLRLDSDCFISHLLIAELLSRGEPVESFRTVVTEQLKSESRDVRRFGRANARNWFQELLSPRLD